MQSMFPMPYVVQIDSLFTGFFLVKAKCYIRKYF